MVDQRTEQLQTAMKRIELTYDETLESLGAALDLRRRPTDRQPTEGTAVAVLKQLKTA